MFIGIIDVNIFIYCYNVRYWKLTVYYNIINTQPIYKY